MKIINTIEDFRSWRYGVSGSVGFVPTMGALHDGHLSLVAEANRICQNTVVSIYLNPAQFSPQEDFDTYPRDLQSDMEALSDYNVDIIFSPEDSEIYPNGFSTYVRETKLSKVLEGKSRPAFFQGVSTVVAKLFNIVNPTHAFFGEKDAQQAAIIQKFVKDMAYEIQIIICPIVRENNGLALSSRNYYLSKKGKVAAANIYKALQAGKNLLISGERDAQKIREGITQIIIHENMLQIDYVSVADANTLIEISGTIPDDILVSIAILIENTRLIDNFSYSIPPKE